MGTSTIKAPGQGGDYTSLSAWEADKNGSIIGLGPEIAECYDVDDTTDVALSGWATSASDYIEIKAVTAARCNGSTRAQTGNTYRLSSATNGVLRNSQPHVRINGIEIKCTTGGIAFKQVSASDSGSDVRVEDCVISSNDASASTNYTVHTTTPALNLQLTNCIITGKRRGMDCRNALTVAVNHCTWFTDAADLGIVADTELTCTNTYAGGFTTQCFWTGGAEPSGSYNASSDTSASVDYTSSLTSKAAADQFTNPSISDSTMDFTLKATADLINAGTGSYATDIAGNARSGTVDIGAFEFVGPSTYEVAASFNIANTLSTSKAADIVASANYATALSNSSPAVMTAEVQASYSNILSMSGLGGAVYDVAASYDMSSGMSNGGLGDISASVNNNIISVLSSTALADMQALIASNIDMNYVISTDAVIGASATFSGGFGYTANFGDLAISAAAGFALAFALSGSAQTDAYAELVNNVNTAISNSTNAIANATTTYTIGNSFVSLGGSDVVGNASFTITTDFASSSSISIEGACAFSTALGLVSSTIIQAESSVSFNVVSGLINSTLATLNAQASFGLQGSFSASRTYVTEAGASITITASMSNTGVVSVFGTVTTPLNRLIKVSTETRIIQVGD